MSRDEVAVADQLAATSLLAGVSTRHIRSLVRRCVRTQVPAGWTLVHEQTPGDACYLLLAGVADVRVRAETVATLGPGDVVGEVALAEARLRNATVVARTPLDLLHIDARVLADVSAPLRAALMSRVDSRRVVAGRAPVQAQSQLSDS